MDNAHCKPFWCEILGKECHALLNAYLLEDLRTVKRAGSVEMSFCKTYANCFKIFE